MKLSVPFTSQRCYNAGPPTRRNKAFFVPDSIIKHAGRECRSRVPLSSRGYTAVISVNSFAALIWCHFSGTQLFTAELGSDAVSSSRPFCMDMIYFSHIAWDWIQRCYLCYLLNFTWGGNRNWDKKRYSLHIISVHGVNM